jgi:hypothetical protein
MKVSKTHHVTKQGVIKKNPRGKNMNSNIVIIDSDTQKVYIGTVPKKYENDPEEWLYDEELNGGHDFGSNIQWMMVDKVVIKRM